MMNDRIAELEAALRYERGLVAEFSKAAIASASEYRAAVLAEREECIDILKKRRNGAYNDWTTLDEQRLIDVIMADIRARPAP